MSDESTNEVLQEQQVEQPAPQEEKKQVKKSKIDIEELNALRAKVEEFENKEKMQKLNEEQKIEALKKEADKFKKQAEKLQQDYASREVMSQIKSEAMANGCVNTEKLIKLLSKDDIKSLEIDQNYQVDKESLKALIEKAKKDHEDIGLFKSKQVNFNNTLPQKQPEKPIISTSNSSEISSALAQILSRSYK